MKEYSPEELEDLLDDLGYALSQPAADHFRQLTRAGEEQEAVQILLDEGYDEDDAKAIYDHFAKELKGCPIVRWREITAEEAIELGNKEVVLLLLRRGSSVFTYGFARWEHNGVVEYKVYHDGDFIDIHEVDQIWVGDKKQ
jgi:hypothetical protein